MNIDGFITIDDSLLIARFAEGMSVDGFWPAAADVDCDGDITNDDALMVADYSAHLRYEFPCGPDGLREWAVGNGRVAGAP